MITAAAAKRSCPWASVTATPIRTPQVRTRVPNYFPAVSCPSLHPLTSLEAVYLILFQLSLLTDYLHFRHWLETLYPLVEELFQAQHCSSSAIPPISANGEHRSRSSDSGGRSWGNFPPTSSSQHLKDSMNYFTQVYAAGMTSRFSCRKER